MVPDNIFIADSLEEAANSLPAEASELAKKLTDAAALYRQFPARRLVHIYPEQIEDLNQAAARVRQ
jgi:hypothetical protein